MDGRREFIIRINPKTCAITVEQTIGQVTKTKKISPAELANCISKSTSEDDMYSSGILPAGCITVLIAPTGEKYFALEYQQRYTDIWYFQKPYKHFPLPRLVFVFRVAVNERVSDAWLTVVEDRPITMESKLFEYPFSNVYNNAKICMGANELPTIESPVALAKLADDIMKMPNNADLFSSEDNRLGLSYESLLEHLKDKAPEYYYSDVLCPRGATLGMLLGVAQKEGVS